METYRCANCDQPLTSPNDECEACEGSRIATEPATVKEPTIAQVSLKAFAKEVGGEYESTQVKKVRIRKVTARWRDWTVTFEEHWCPPDNVSGAILLTSVRTPFQAEGRLRLRAYRRKGLSAAVVLALAVAIGAVGFVGLPLAIVSGIAVGIQKGDETLVWLLGWAFLSASLAFAYMMRQEQDVRDSEFRRDVRVRGNDKDKIRAFFANSKIRQLFRDLPRGSWLKVDQPWRLFGQGFGRTELRFDNEPGQVVDSDQLKSLHALVSESLDQLVAIGSATEDAPENVSDS